MGRSNQCPDVYGGFGVLHVPVSFCPMDISSALCFALVMFLCNHMDPNKHGYIVSNLSRGLAYPLTIRSVLCHWHRTWQTQPATMEMNNTGWESQLLVVVHLNTAPPPPPSPLHFHLSTHNHFPSCSFLLATSSFVLRATECTLIRDLLCLTQ